MRQRSPAFPAQARGLLLAALTTVLTVTGHLVGGGSLPGLVPVAVLVPLLGVVLVTVADRCRGIVALLLALGAGQVALHLLLLLLATHAEHAMAAETFSTPSMVTGHAVATLVIAAGFSHAESAVLAVVAALMRVLPRRLRMLAIDVEPSVRPVPPPDIPLRAAHVSVGGHVRRGPPLLC